MDRRDFVLALGGLSALPSQAGKAEQAAVATPVRTRKNVV